jgi:PAS domain S-box-containing protein
MAASLYLQRWALLSFLLLEIPAHAKEPPLKQMPLPTLTRVAEVRALTPDRGRLGYPVRLRAVVTYYDQNHGDMFVQDATAGVYLDPSNLTLALQPGQLVEVEGISGPGDFASQVNKPRVRILGKAPMPAPQRVSAELLAGGTYDSQWIEIEGVVRSVAEYDGRLMLDMFSGGVEFKAFVLNYRPIPKDLVDARVRVRGVSGGIYNPKNQYLGVEVLIPSLADLRVIKPALSSVFSLPVRPIHILLRLTPQGAFSQRVHVQGVVTLQRLGRSFFVRDEQEGLLVETNQMTPLGVGDRVDVVGFPDVGEYTPILRHAAFQKMGSGPRPEPADVTAAVALGGRYDAELVRIEGRLLDRATRPGGQTLVLRAGELTFEADLEDTKYQYRVASLRSGSLLRLTGICAVQVNENREPQGFRILLRSPGDIVVLALPTWWNLEHLLWAMGILGALILGALVWVGILRSQVSKQTRALQESLDREASLKHRYQELFENANDVVYTHDIAGKITSVNRAGEKISGYTRNELLMMDIAQIVAPENLSAARQMIERKLAGGGPTAYEIEITAKDGRRVPMEVSTRLIYEDGRPVSIQGIARDITDRKRAEEALRNLHRRLLQFQDEERRRIARDLHDTTAQNLAALVMNLGAVARSVDHLSPRARDAFSESLALARQASREIRTLSYLLHPPMLDEFGLAATLRGYVEGFGKRSGIHVDLDMSPQIGRLSRESEITVYRIVQESLANIYQHSGSKSAQIRIDLNANAVKVEIKDRGRGMAVRAVKKMEKGDAASPGVGIPGMRERVMQLGGELTIQTGKGGTTVTAVLPLDESK